MAQIPYSYISLDLDRELHTPITEEEFTGLKQQGEKFIKKILKTTIEKSNPIKQLNTMYFSKGLVTSYLISLFNCGITNIDGIFCGQDSRRDSHIYSCCLSLDWNSNISISRLLLQDNSRDWTFRNINEALL